nr:carotenoid biosynthesis protein [Allomuricauda sp.]
MTRDKFYKPFSWVMVTLILGITFIYDPIKNINNPMFVFFAALPLVCAHSIRRYGLKATAFLFIITYVISNFWENLSIYTGFPFGNYHYTGGPKLVQVPVFIGIAYISLGYTCLQVANAIFGEIDTRLNKISSVFIFSVMAAICMTVYDLSTDPQASTLAGSWVWKDGGEFFGVPVKNFIGWWFCTVTFYFPFAYFLKKNPTLVRKESKTYLFQFIIIYVCMGMTVVVANICKMDMVGEVVDKAGTLWQKADLAGSTLLWAIFGMFTLAFLAFVNLYRIGLPKELKKVE